MHIYQLIKDKLPYPVQQKRATLTHQMTFDNIESMKSVAFGYSIIITDKFMKRLPNTDISSTKKKNKLQISTEITNRQQNNKMYGFLTLKRKKNNIYILFAVNYFLPYFACMQPTSLIYYAIKRTRGTLGKIFASDSKLFYITKSKSVPKFSHRKVN